MLSKLTLIGINNYTNGAIWDDIELPEGLDKDILVNEILRRNGEFPVVWPDADFLKIQIDFFFKKWKHNFTRWVEAANKEYEALYNVDVTTTTTEEGTNEANSASSGQNNGTVSRSGSGTSNGTSGNTSTESKAAYDSNTFQNTKQIVDSGSTSLSTSETGSETTSATNSESMTSNSEHEILTEEYKRGNQGITMSQELLAAEYNIWLFNLYNQIADIFASEFCVCIYV